MTGSSIGFSTYAIPLLLGTGLFLLRVDAKKYVVLGMSKETTTTRFLGWFNIIMGVLLLAAKWVLRAV